MILRLDLRQWILLLSLFATIVAWVIDRPSKTVSSLFLLAIFIVFGYSPIKEVLSFPLSWNFFLIVLSYVFSQGIINSNLGEKLFKPFLSRYSRNVYEFIGVMTGIIIVLVFTIPQPFARVILLAMIYESFFDEVKMEKDTRSILFLAMFAINIIVHMFFKRGDIVLNNAILAVADVEMTEFQWMKSLMIPAMGFLVLGLASIFLVFRKELENFKGNANIKQKIKLDKNDKVNLLIILGIIGLWATESLHGINGTIVVFMGLILMYLRKIVDRSDLRAINYELLVFLTAVFSIGKVMVQSGIADVIFGQLTQYVPNVFSIKFVGVIALSTMGLHMILGSNMTTMSVAIPSFISIAGPSIDPMVIMLIVFVSIVSQYILPIHNSLLVVGSGNKYYTNKQVIRLGLALNIVTLISLFFFFIPWWKFIGII